MGVWAQDGLLTLPDEKFVNDIISLLGLGPAKTSDVPGKFSKWAGETIQELAGQYIDLCRRWLESVST